MEQNINLLNALPHKAKSFISAKQSAIMVTALIVLLLIVYAFGTISVSKNQEGLKKLEATKQSISSQMDDLNKQIQSLNTQISKANIPQLSPNAIFFYCLEKLATITPEGISLENITVSIPDNSITLSGKTNSTHLLSYYLGTVNKTHVLENQQLNTIKLQKNEHNILDFTLSNTRSAK